MKVNGKDIMKLNKGSTWTLTVPRSAYGRLEHVESMEFSMDKEGIHFRPVPMDEVTEKELYKYGIM